MRNTNSPTLNIGRLLNSQGRDIHWLSQATGISVDKLHAVIVDGREPLMFEDAAVIADALDCDLPVLVHGNEEAAVGIPEIAAMLRMSNDSIYRMVRGGDLPGFKVRGVWRFFPSEVRAHVKAPKSDPWAQSARSRSRKRVA